MNDMKTVMNQLKILRQDSEITVNEVSEYIEKALGEKISPKTIYGWESGMAKPTIPVFMCMCMCYKINVCIRHMYETQTCKKLLKNF